MITARILEPANGAKLYAGRSLDVVVAVGRDNGGEDPCDWSVAIEFAGERTLLAEGRGPLNDGRVATLRRSQVEADGPAEIVFSVVGCSDGAAEARAEVIVVAPKYQLIPFNRIGLSGRSMSSDGERILVGRAPGISDLLYTMLDRSTGQRQILSVRASNSDSPNLSQNGQKLFFVGRVPQDDGLLLWGLAMRDLASGLEQMIAEGVTLEQFSVDASGTKVAFINSVSGQGVDAQFQYFFADLETGEVRQVTDAPDAIDIHGFPLPCPEFEGTRPLLSADGRHMVFTTASTLGVAPGPAGPCRVFVYDTETDSLALRYSFPPTYPRVKQRALSADGRWLSFTASVPNDPDSPFRGIAGLLDLEEGVGSNLLPDDTLGVFDSVVSPDGRYVVISSRMDLDPVVGNRDQNMELFVYDRETEEFAQIAETTLGIGLLSVGCSAIQPLVSEGAEVVLFGFQLLSVEACQLAGAQRDEVTGFQYRLVRAVRIRPDNQGPQWLVPSLARVEAGETLEIDFAALDPDGDPISYFAQARGGDALFPGSSFEDFHDGTAQFRWATQLEDVGSYPLRVAVYDEGGGMEMADIAVHVCRRVQADTSLLAVLRALLRPTDLPVACNAADLNGDGAITAADLVAALW